MIVDWENDRGAAAVLAKMDLSWTQVVVAAKDIDVKLSRHNKARLSPLNNSTVEDYRDAMEAGDVFPCIVIARVNGAQKYVIAGGNHRHEAALMLNETEFFAMAVDCDDMQFDVLCRRLNLVVGQREDRSVRAEQAADLVSRRKMTVKDAAAQMGVLESAVSKVLCRRRSEEACVRFQVPVTGLDAGDFATLHAIKDDAVMLPLAAALLRMKMRDADVAKLITSAKSQPTEAKRKELLTQAVEQQKRVSRTGRNLSKPERTAIVKAITALETRINNPEATLCSLQMTPQEALEYQNKLADVANRMASLIRGYEKAQN